MYVVDTLTRCDQFVSKGFVVEVLTKYSEADGQRPTYISRISTYLFDFCKRHFSVTWRLLHDYDFYDFTLVVRKRLRKKSNSLSGDRIHRSGWSSRYSRMDPNENVIANHSWSVQMSALVGPPPTLTTACSNSAKSRRNPASV